jgi:hypothetical protein
LLPIYLLPHAGSLNDGETNCKHDGDDRYHHTMIRTQIQLTEAQAVKVKRVAASRGVSIAEVLRELIDEHLADNASADHRTRALRVVGRHRSGRADVSDQHDRDVAEAFRR